MNPSSYPQAVTLALVLIHWPPLMAGTAPPVEHFGARPASPAHRHWRSCIGLRPTEGDPPLNSECGCTAVHLSSTKLSSPKESEDAHEPIPCELREAEACTLVTVKAMSSESTRHISQHVHNRPVVLHGKHIVSVLGGPDLECECNTSCNLQV